MMFDNAIKELEVNNFYNNMPFEPILLCDKRNIVVRSVNFKTNYNFILGYIQKKKDGSKVMYINKRLPKNDIRYIVCCLLGVDILNIYKDNKYVKVNKMNISKDEKLIDSFSKSLLINKNKLIEYYDLLKDIGFSNESILISLSELFIVSKNLIEIRLKELKKI